MRKAPTHATIFTDNNRIAIRMPYICDMRKRVTTKGDLIDVTHPHANGSARPILDPPGRQISNLERARASMQPEPARRSAHYSAIQTTKPTTAMTKTTAMRCISAEKVKTFRSCTDWNAVKGGERAGSSK